MFTEEVVATNCTDIDIITAFADKACKRVGMGVGLNDKACTLVESRISIFDFPPRSTASLSPVEDYAVALQVGIGEVGDIGTEVGGEGNGVAPLAGIVYILTRSLNSGVVDHIGIKTGNGFVGDIAVRISVGIAVEEVNTVAVVVLLRIPTEGYFAVGHFVNTKSPVAAKLLGAGQVGGVWTLIAIGKLVSPASQRARTTK